MYILILTITLNAGFALNYEGVSSSIHSIEFESERTCLSALDAWVSEKKVTAEKRTTIFSAMCVKK